MEQQAGHSQRLLRHNLYPRFRSNCRRLHLVSTTPPFAECGGRYEGGQRNGGDLAVRVKQQDLLPPEALRGADQEAEQCGGRPDSPHEGKHHLEADRLETLILLAIHRLPLRAWVFITGGCSRRGVHWMGVVLCSKTAYNIM